MVASAGTEYFIFYENKNRQRLYAFVRLPIYPSPEINQLFPVLKDGALIRELHIYGQLIELKGKKEGISGPASWPGQKINA
ncbi:MAG: hypothetical protein PHI73_04280 [Patescibacteria group bacterium]|nr:hypothetical protein [Patescibacteria group bacterium]